MTTPDDDVVVTGPNRTRLSSADRKAQVLAIATEMFVEHGRGGVEPRHIAVRAGITESRLYHLFGSKENIFQEAVLEPLERLVNRVAELCASLSGLDPESRDAAGYRVHCEILEQMHQITPLLGAALYSDQGARSPFAQENLLPLLERVERSLSAGFESWKHRDIDPSMITSIICGTYQWMVMKHSLSGEPIDIEHTTAMLASILVRGAILDD